MNNFFKLILALIALAPAPAARAFTPTSVQEAQEWFTTNSSHGVEGIWEFTEDRVQVAIIRSNFDELPEYDLIVVDSYNGTLLPGSTLGCLSASAKSGEYKLKLSTRHSTRLKSNNFRECKANIGEDGYSMTITPVKGKLRITFSPMTILPNFWRVLKINERENRDLPAAGFIKIFPSYDGNGSSRFSPRTL